MKVSAVRTKTGAKAEAEFEMPATLAELVTKFTEETVVSHAKGSLIVSLQGFMRSQLDQGKTQDEIQTAVRDWKPGARRPGKSPQEKVREGLAKLTPEQRKEMLAEIRAELQAAAGGASQSPAQEAAGTRGRKGQAA